MGDFIQTKVLPLFMRFVNTRGVRAIKDGMMFTMPLIIVGAVYLLLFQLPIQAAADFVSSLGNGAVVSYLSHGYTSSFQIIAMVAAIGVGYTWAKNDGWEPLSAGIIALALFLIFIPDYVGSTFNAAGTITALDSETAAQGAGPATVETLSKYVLSGEFETLGEAAGAATSEALTKYADIQNKEDRADKVSEHIVNAVKSAAEMLPDPADNAEIKTAVTEAAASGAAAVAKSTIETTDASAINADELAAAANAGAVAGGQGAVNVYAPGGTGGLNKTWLAGQGMIGAMIAGMLSGLIYSAFMKKDIRIKMPEGVPDGVAAAFTGLIPAAVILTGGVVVYGLCMGFGGVTPIELIYKFIQAPLQGVGDTLPGVLLFETLIPLLWFFGVHGATVVGSVAQPIELANQAENAAIFQRLVDGGMSRADAIAALPQNGGHIFTEAFCNCFQAITGSGITIGLVIFMVFFAKSAQMKQVGKLGLGCGIFNINEPVLFGTPIVLNPKLLLPFVLAPIVSNGGAYILTQIGFIPYTMGVTVPWTTPPILSGLLCIGWQAAAWQAITLAASFFIYLPFARSVDNDYLAMEEGQDPSAAAGDAA